MIETKISQQHHPQHIIEAKKKGIIALQFSVFYRRNGFPIGPAASGQFIDPKVGRERTSRDWIHYESGTNLRALMSSPPLNTISPVPDKSGADTACSVPKIQTSARLSRESESFCADSAAGFWFAAADDFMEHFPARPAAKSSHPVLARNQLGGDLHLCRDGAQF